MEETHFLLAFDEEEFFAPLAMTGSEVFFNKLLDQGRNGLRLLRQRQKCRFTDRQAPMGARSMSTSMLRIAMLIVVFVSPVHLAWSQSSGTTSYEVKTAFLFNFAKYIDWPASSFASSKSPFTICVLGQDPFGNILDETLLGKVIESRSLVIRRLKDKTEARSCQMVFVCASESAHLPEILASVHGANVLLIGETAGFALLGGTIEFTLDENNRVRFTINSDAAGRSGLNFSSKLLALAKIVHDPEHSKGG
jgi:YfiR/HmsC-like